MSLSLKNYSVAWSDHLISRVETHLRDIHSALHQYYEKEGYPTTVEDKSSGSGAAATAGGDADEEAAPSGTTDVVSPAGSFLLRTCVHAIPYANLHAERGVGADLVVTMPEEKCGLADLQDGNYLVKRQRFVEEMEGYLNRLVQGAAKRVAAAAAEQRGKKRTRAADDNDDDASDKDGEEEEDEKDASNIAAAERLSRMVVARLPIHGCYANREKELLRLRFLRRSSGDNNDGGFHQRHTYETFYVDLHFRPAQPSGRVMSAAAARKHPYYSYLALEDFAMPAYLKKIHKMCVEADGLRRALVILKSWAHHVGLMASASGHQEGLSGFLLACMLLKLQEDGIVSGATSEENAARAVWIRLSQGYFLPPPQAPAGTSKAGRPVVPAAEERGEVAVLRLNGEVMNVLFRSTAAFFKDAVQRAAGEALMFPSSADVFANTPFQQLQLRYDVALTLHSALRAGGDDDKGDADDDADNNNINNAAGARLRKASVFMSPLALQVQEQCLATLQTALVGRAAFVSVWPTGPDALQVIVRLTSETEGRSHLTRGPPIEDEAAVATFNEFWGASTTSTRQFPDGAIYRCVLWTFPEAVVGGCATATIPAPTVLRKVAEFALRRHANADARASVLLGGLDGYLVERIGAEWRDAAQVMQRALSDASQEVQQLIANLPRAVLPCKITDFSIIAASARNTEVFPVRPHLALTETTDNLDAEAYTGLSTAATIEPIHCVMAIDDKGKIPDTVEAISMMKSAICAQLAKYIHSHHAAKRGEKKKAAGTADGAAATAAAAAASATIHAYASPHSVDIICRGFLFRVYVGHYREVSLLRALQREGEANMLEQKLFWTTQHAKFVASIAYGHHSYSAAVRLAKRWVSAMMLLEFVQPEAVELLVANAYLTEVGTSTSTSTTGNSSMVMGAPRTAAGGFLRFIQLLASHDWKKPLVLPFTDDEKDPTTAARRLLRKLGEHQGMYIAAPYAPSESPFTFHTPRPMIVHRLVQLAKGVLSLLMSHLSPSSFSHTSHHHHHSDGDGADADTAVEQAMFTSDPAAFDFAMAFHPQLILQPDRCITVRGAGADALAAAEPHGTHDDEDGAPTPDAAPNLSARPVVRIRQLDELPREQARQYIAALVEREPAAHAVRTLRAALRDQGMIFYDALAPTAIHVVGVTAAPLQRKSQAMHDEIVRIARGAVLPAAHGAFTPAPRRAAADAQAKAAGQKKENGTDSAEALLQSAIDSKKGKAGAAPHHQHAKNNKHHNNKKNNKPRGKAAGDGEGGKQPQQKKAKVEAAAVAAAGKKKDKAAARK